MLTQASKGLLRHPYTHTITKTLARWTHYLFLGVKFTTFLSIELGMFPALCGLILNVSTLSLFSSTLAQRQSLIMSFPVSQYALHWCCGTVCMFQLSHLVAAIRGIVRPGVLWFVRDPSDPDFQPLNEILVRPVGLQLRKLAVGVVLYTCIITTFMGGVAFCVHSLTGPLRLEPR